MDYTVIVAVFIFTAGISVTAWMNKNAIMLQHSGSVKSKIADKRHGIYLEIIAHIETWHGDKADCPFDLKCGANHERPLELGIFDHKITDAQKLEDELVAIVGLTKYHPYLNNDTYTNLKYLESYLLKVKQYVDEYGFHNESFFPYMIYLGMHPFHAKVQESVQYYLRHPNSLSWKFQFAVKGRNFSKLYGSSDFYHVYELEQIIKQKTEQEVCRINKKRKKNRGYRLYQKCKKCSAQCVLKIPTDSQST